MNWDAIGAVGEILGALAVFASLIYLAVQIRGQAKQQRKHAIDQLTENWLDVLETQTHTDAAEVWAKGISDVENLDLTERVQFYSITGRMFRICEGFYLSYTAGDLDEEVWKGQSAMLEDILMHPGVVRVWDDRKHWFTRPFCEYADSKIGSGQSLFYESSEAGI